MVANELVLYIKQQLQRGYDIAAIRSFLIQNNYPQQEVDAAIQYLFSRGAQQPTQPQTPKTQPPIFSKKTILIVFVLLIVLTAIALTAWLFMNIEIAEELPISFNIKVDVDMVAPGGTLYISNEFINLPDEREYPTTIYYTITDTTKTRIDSWQISFGASDAIIKNTKYAVIPSTQQGTYTLEAKMSYGTISNQAKTSFKVSTSKEELAEAEDKAEEKVEEVEKEEEEEITVLEEAKEGEEELEETAEDVSVTRETSIPSSNDYQNYAAAKELAATDAESAVGYCEQISTLTKKDECYWAVAKASGEKNYCEDIVADHTRDACWIGFAFDKNDYTVCEEIANPFIKQSCEQLEKVAELKMQQGVS